LWPESPGEAALASTAEPEILARVLASSDFQEEPAAERMITGKAPQ
jgi:hypothetical protein